jgi:hypothetical protein
MIRLETLISIFNLRRLHVENRLSWKLDKERMFTLQISIDGQSKAMLQSDEPQIYIYIYIYICVCVCVCVYVYIWISVSYYPFSVAPCVTGMNEIDFLGHSCPI